MSLAGPSNSGKSQHICQRKSTDRIAATPRATIMVRSMVLRVANIVALVLALTTAWPSSIHNATNALPTALADAGQSVHRDGDASPAPKPDDETGTDPPLIDLTSAVSLALPPDPTDSGTRTVRGLAQPQTRVEGRMGCIANDERHPSASPIHATLAADARWATTRLFVVAPQLRAHAPPASA